ncbi:hypothetical protein PG994_003534 [Apiospora phragmitis]|uniref:Uncharacterized protein n=1 Tax=Apiospora phragmitis TaxID=2905665 RepID=A0ABR1VYF2_9PEZI
MISKTSNIDTTSYTAQQDSASTFLHLPCSVRRQIYIEAGLLVNEDIIVHRRPGRAWRLRDKSDDGYRFVYSILQTCRAIHDELRDLLFSRNRLIVDHHDVKWGLNYLRRLPPRACAQLQSLHVHLYLEAPRKPAWYKDDSTFRRSCPLEGDYIDAWKVTADHVLAHTDGQTLKLHLVCDTGDSEATTAVLQPLMDYPGSLRDCQIRLIREERAVSVA